MHNDMNFCHLGPPIEVEMMQDGDLELQLALGQLLDDESDAASDLALSCVSCLAVVALKMNQWF